MPDFDYSGFWYAARDGIAHLSVLSSHAFVCAYQRIIIAPGYLNGKRHHSPSRKRYIDSGINLPEAPNYSVGAKWWAPKCNATTFM